MKWKNLISTTTTCQDGVKFHGGKNFGIGGVGSAMLIAFLLGGYLNNCVVTPKLRAEIKSLKIKQESYKALVLACQMSRARAIAEIREDSFIPSPGRLRKIGAEFEFQEFVDEYFENSNSTRICFGRGWSTNPVEVRSLD